MTNEEKLKQMNDRNAAICRHYEAGHSVRLCASQFKLGRMRVLQILKAAGVWKPYEKGDRTKFVGVNLSEETKDALKRKADEQGISLSRVAAEELDKAVADRTAVEAAK